MAMTSSFVQALLNPKKNILAAIHMKTVSNRLRKVGLRFEDLYDPMEDMDIKEALNRLPREIVDARIQRLQRAMDLSMKHEELPQDLQVCASRRCEYI
ncbi:reductase [Lithospermum erythrorhizon]|uniref:Cytochrome b-c1 complex subunit 7 n=1 Tax=Lithospermum erythrorhizon TaxID=34254 RepID=A0AAV3PAZ6_LITER